MIRRIRKDWGLARAGYTQLVTANHLGWMLWAWFLCKFVVTPWPVTRTVKCKCGRCLTVRSKTPFELLDFECTCGTITKCLSEAS